MLFIVSYNKLSINKAYGSCEPFSFQKITPPAKPVTHLGLLICVEF